MLELLNNSSSQDDDAKSAPAYETNVTTGAGGVNKHTEVFIRQSELPNTVSMRTLRGRDLNVDESDADTLRHTRST